MAGVVYQSNQAIMATVDGGRATLQGSAVTLAGLDVVQRYTVFHHVPVLRIDVWLANPAAPWSTPP